MSKDKAKQLIQQLAEKEQKVLRAEILSPFYPYAAWVYTKVDHLVYRFAIAPMGRVGFGIFRPVDFRRARFVREAEAERVREYLTALPRVKAILVFQTGTWYAYPVSHAAYRKQGFRDVRPCHRAEGVSLFDYVVCAFDGFNLWFLEIDHHADVEKIERMRAGLHTKSLNKKSLTPEDLQAYALALKRKEDQERLTVEGRLKYRLGLLGAQLLAYRDLGQRLEVQWRSAAGGRYTSVVRSSDFALVSAGICLSGEDRKFDLAGLIGVIAEGERDHLIHHMDFYEE